MAQHLAIENADAIGPGCASSYAIEFPVAMSGPVTLGIFWAIIAGREEVPPIRHPML